MEFSTRHLVHFTPVVQVSWNQLRPVQVKSEKDYLEDISGCRRDRESRTTQVFSRGGNLGRHKEAYYALL